MDLQKLMNNNGGDDTKKKVVVPNGIQDLTFIPPRGGAPPHHNILLQQERETSCGRGSLGMYNNNQRIISSKTGHRNNNNNKLCSRGHWRPHEDAKLKELVSQFGPQNWNLIADKLQGRSGKSCRLRWFNQLDPRINKRAFSEEEEERLLAAQNMYGSKWALIARVFPGRTDNAVKNHFHVIMARKRRSSIFRHHHGNAASACSESTGGEKEMVGGMGLGRSEMKIQGNISNKFYEMGSKCNNAGNVDHYKKSSNHSSDSNSEVLSSSSESVPNFFMCAAGENEKKIAFFDFLGVGST